MTDFPDIIRSPLSQNVTQDGITVRVEIYRVDGTEGWTLEVVDAEGGVEQLGLAKLIDPDDDDLATVH